MITVLRWLLRVRFAGHLASPRVRVFTPATYLERSVICTCRSLVSASSHTGLKNFVVRLSANQHILIFVANVVSFSHPWGEIQFWHTKIPVNGKHSILKRLQYYFTCTSIDAGLSSWVGSLEVRQYLCISSRYKNNLVGEKKKKGWHINHLVRWSLYMLLLLAHSIALSLNVQIMLPTKILLDTGTKWSAKLLFWVHLGGPWSDYLFGQLVHIGFPDSVRTGGQPRIYRKIPCSTSW